MLYFKYTYMVKLKEKLIKSKNVFNGKLLKVYQDEVQLPNGKSSTREFIKHPGASACIPFLTNSKIGLIKQYRYSVGEEMYEIPAGKINMNESPIECARRELEEEIGFQSQKLTFLTKIHPAVGFCDEIISIYIAENLIKTSTKFDDDEFVELIPTTMKDALKMVRRGLISDVKTIIALFWYDKYYRS